MEVIVKTRKEMSGSEKIVFENLAKLSDSPLVKGTPEAQVSILLRSSPLRMEV